MQRYEDFLEYAKEMYFFCNFNKKTSTAVPLWNERYEEILKCANIKEKKYQNYSKLFFLRVLFIGSEYYSRHGRTIRAREI